MVVESEKLQAALAKVRTSILLDYGELFGSEERCRQRVIDPILSALGWDIFSDEVVVEHPLPSSKGSKGQKGENGTEEEAKKPKRGAPPALDYVLYEVLPWGKLPRVVIEAKAIRELQKEICCLLKSKGQKAVDTLRSKCKCKEVPDDTAGEGQKGSAYGSLLALLDVPCWYKDKGQPQGGEKTSQNEGQASKKTSCPNFNLAQTGIRANQEDYVMPGIPVYEVGRYVMPSRIIITSGVRLDFHGLRGTRL
jgi:hypothetical protein